MTTHYFAKRGRKGVKSSHIVLRYLAPDVFSSHSTVSYFSSFDLKPSQYDRGFSDSSVGKESVCNAGDPRFDSWVGKIHWRRDRLPTPVCLVFPCGSTGKESTCNVGELSSAPGLKIPWRRERLPIPQFKPGEFHGLYSLWCCKELGTTEQLSLTHLDNILHIQKH